jgi:hypothetical protein
MLTLSPKRRQNPVDGRAPHPLHSDKHACSQVGALFSGLPQILRDRAGLMVLQAWFDESGKGQEPVYLLAGYVGDVEMWKRFSDEWQAELDREPKLPYLHVSESQLFKGLNPAERKARILEFVKIIRNHRPFGITFTLKHSDYRRYFNVLSRHPSMTRAERRMFKNPYFVAFQFVLGLTLLRQAKRGIDSGVEEVIEILFDEDIDRRSRLEIGFKYFLDTMRRRTPQFLPLLINEGPEFRDDKRVLPLQAADLLAWHLRRAYFESDRDGIPCQNPVWLELRREGMEYQDFIYTESQWLDLLERMYNSTLYVAKHGKLPG